jgi:hypothetical protein
MTALEPISPELLETRHQILHGQEVEIKVYGPGGAHICDDTVKIPPCPICRPRGRAYDPDRKGIRLKNIEQRWPVALGITEGYHEPISGAMEYLPPPCAFTPRSYVKRFAPEPDPHPRARAVFFSANWAAKTRLYRKAMEAQYKRDAATPKEIAKRRRNREQCRLRAQRKRAEWRKAQEQREEQIASHEASKLHCAAESCDMGPWTRITRVRFQELLGRLPEREEIPCVRGCSNCPAIEVAPRYPSIIL